RAGRGRARALPRQGGGRLRLRARLRVTVRRALAAALVALAAATGVPADSLPALEGRAKSFYDLLEHGEKERAAARFPDLERALQRSLDELQDRMDKMRDEVMERDGDIEALYKEPRWREPEIASLVVIYHLAWVRYQGAQLTTDEKKKSALLDAAVEG